MKSIVIAAAAVLALSCNQSKIKTQEEINQDYIAKAQQFFDYNFTGKDETDIAAVEILKVSDIDSLREWSVYDKSYQHLIDLYKNQATIIKLLPRTSGPGDSEYDYQMDELEKLEAKIKHLSKISDKLDTNSFPYKGVFFEIKFHLLDGTVATNSVPLIFDKDGNLHACNKPGYEIEFVNNL